MDMIELIATEGFAYVNRSHRLIGYYLYCPDQQSADLWVLTPLRRSGRRKTKNDTAMKKRSIARSENARKTL